MSYEDEVADLRALVKQLSDENAELRSRQTSQVNVEVGHMGLSMNKGDVLSIGSGAIQIMFKGRRRGAELIVVRAPKDFLVKRIVGSQDWGEGA